MDIGMTVEVLFYTIILYLPAMTANATPVFIKKGKPIDGGRMFIDGKRLLGDGKTYEGFFVGFYFGLVVISSYIILTGYPSYILWGTLSVIGALLGDMLGSFIKRRLNIPRGGKAFLLDQLDFFFGATIGLYVGGMTPGPYIILCGLLIVLILHVLTNRIAYILGLKDVPW